MKTKPAFAPILTIDNGVTNVDFYKEAFGATVLRRFSNDDGSLHVVEMEINGAMFHLHEQTQRYKASPTILKCTTVTIGLFVDDVDAVIEKAVKAGATVTDPPQDYFYGYRQGEIADPFGHRWLIEKVI